MKYRCQVCKQYVEAKDVIGHAATHSEARIKAAQVALHRLTPLDRVAVLATFCGSCGFAAPEHAIGCASDGLRAAVALALPVIERDLREHDAEYHHVTRPSTFEAIGALKARLAKEAGQ